MTATEEDGDPRGSTADEAVRLLAALADRAREHLGSVAPDPHVGHAPECRWCPVCQGVAFVRDASPELREQVVSVATSLLLALRDLADGLAQPAGPAGRTPGQAVQHIDLDDGDDPGWG